MYQFMINYFYLQDKNTFYQSLLILAYCKLTCNDKNASVYTDI